MFTWAARVFQNFSSFSWFRNQQLQEIQCVQKLVFGRLKSGHFRHFLTFLDIFLHFQNRFKNYRIESAGQKLLNALYHSFFGVLFAVCSCFVMVTAFQTSWFKKQLKEEFVQPIQASFSLVIVYAYVLIVFQVYNRYKSSSNVEYEAVPSAES